MNLKQLEYFTVAAETLNFTRAASRCFISQTAMTQQIHALEDAVGVPLFIRDKHHVQLTTAGEVYYKEAKRILEQSEEAVRLARLAAEGDDGELSVGFISGYGQSDCPGMMNSFRRAFPNIKIKLIHNTMSGLMEGLEKGELDLAFCLTGSQFHAQYPDIDHKYLKSYPLMAVLPQGHPLSSRDMVEYPDLKDERFIIMQPSARSQDKMEELILLYDRGGFIPNVVHYDEEPETILLMAALGMGICLMPEYLVRQHLRDSNLKILPIVRSDGSAETLDFEMAWARENVNPALQKLLQCAAAYKRTEG